MNELKRAMGDLLVDEPSAGVDIVGVLAAGRSARRTRRVLWGLAAGVVVAGVVLALPFVPSPLARDAVVPVTPLPVPADVVFQTSRGMAMVREDGSNPEVFLDQGTSIGQGTSVGHADWSPDGRHIAFVRDDAEQTADIWIADRDGGNQRQLLDCIAPCAFAEDPAWSPDGTRMAYWTTEDDTTQMIGVLDVASGAVELTVPFPEFQGPVNPRWSPDGGSLAVSIGHYVPIGNVVREDGAAIGVIELGGAVPTVRRITPFSSLATYPAWSPTGDRIVFVGGNLDPAGPLSSGRSNLYSIRPDGTGLTQLTDLGAEDPEIAEPDWTSLDRPLLVVLVSVQGPSLATLAADGTGLSQLIDPSTGEPVAGTHPRRAPAPG